MSKVVYDAIIIGGGACGLMCAVQAGFLGKKVLIIEHNENVGAKILISGGGRCNYTNLHVSEENYITQNKQFLKSAFSKWTPEDTISFFEMYNIFPTEKTLGQLFPENAKAKDILNVFVDLCKDLGQDILCKTQVLDINKVDDVFEVECKDLITGNLLSFTVENVVVATGGLAISKLGATDFGLKIASKFGLAVVPTSPALVPLTVTGKNLDWFADLSGTSIKARVSVNNISFEENILFTHWGLSGPAILQISSYWNIGDYLYIDLLPDYKILDLLEKERLVNGKKTLSGFLEKLFTKKFVLALGKYLPLDKNIASLTISDFQVIEEFIHKFKIKPAGFKGYDKAEAMKGGVSTLELSSKSFESKKVKGLFFGGECVDVTGWLGGYNFQWAWASGFVIAQNI